MIFKKCTALLLAAALAASSAGTTVFASSETVSDENSDHFENQIMSERPKGGMTEFVDTPVTGGTDGIKSYYPGRTLLLFGSSTKKYDTNYGYEKLAAKDNGAACQAFYESLERAAADFEKGTTDVDSTYPYIASIDYVSLGMTLNEARSVYRVWLNDNPQYFWANSGAGYTLPEKSLLLGVQADYLTYDSRKAGYDLIAEKMEEYKAVADNYSTNYEKAMAVHDILTCENMYAYDSSGYPSTDATAHNVIGVLDDDLDGVCESFAKTYSMALNYIGVDCIYAINDEHAWNYVEMDDGNFYGVDTTWDVEWKKHSGYDGYYTWFALGSEDFTSDNEHIPYTSSGEGYQYLYDIPEIPAENYKDAPTGTFTSEDCSYSYIGLNAKLTGYSGSDGEVNIPEKVNGKYVRTIAQGAMKNTDVESLVIPDTVVRIDSGSYYYNGAFYNSPQLSSVKLSNKLRYIGDYAFLNCPKLEEIYVTYKTSYIGSYALGYYLSSSESETYDLTLYGETGSEAETYASENKLTFNAAEPISSCTAELDQISLIYNGHEYTPAVTVKNGNITLVNGTDYILSYSDNVNVGTASVTICGIGKYAGKIVLTFTIQACPHTNETLTNSKNESCTADGYKTYTCSNCGNVRTVIITATGHSYGEWSTTKAATCTTDGIKTRKCSVCSTEDTQTIPATGHTSVTDGAVAATCTTAGKTEGSHCSVCGTIIKAQESVPATGHSYGEWYITKSATCTTDGIKTRKCSACSAEDTQTIPATGHKAVIDSAVAATCTSAGKTEGSHCSVCGTIIKAQEIVSPTGHTESGWIIDKAAGVGTTGSKHTECTVCKKVIKTETIPALEAVKLSSCTISGISNKAFTGSAITQSITVKYGSQTLTKDKDYTVSYSNNKNIGTAAVTITGKGNYTGSVTKTFAINPAKQTIQKLETRYKGFYVDWAQKGSATGYEIQYATNSSFSGAQTKKLTANKPDTCTISGLTADKTYYVRVRSYTTPGDGKTYYGAWSDSKSIKTAKYNFANAKVSGISTKAYTGKAITQNITVKYGSKTLKNGTDYTISYSGNKNIGTAKITITGKGSYGGVITKTFKINPAKQTIQKLTAKSKAFFVDWSQKGSATGYEIQYSTSSKFTSPKTVTITNNKTDTTTVSKLSGNKKYYVRVRSYTVVNGTKYYGAWSDSKSVTTKK